MNDFEQIKSKPDLQNAKFTFTQEGNCLSRPENNEEIEIECVADIGIDNADGCFFKITTDGWSFDSLDELKTLLDRIQKSINKP